MQSEESFEFGEDFEKKLNKADKVENKAEEEKTVVNVNEIDGIISSIMSRDGDIPQLYHILYELEFTPQLPDEVIDFIIQDSMKFEELIIANPALAFLSKLSHENPLITEAYFKALDEKNVLPFVASAPTQATLDFFVILSNMEKSELFLTHAKIISTFMRNENVSTDEARFFYFESAFTISMKMSNDLSQVKEDDFIPLYGKIMESLNDPSSLSEDSLIAALHALRGYIGVLSDRPELFSEGGALDIIMHLYTNENEEISKTIVMTIFLSLYVFDKKKKELKLGFIQSRNMFDFLVSIIDGANENVQILIVDLVIYVIREYSEIGKEWIRKSVDQSLADFALEGFGNGSLRMKVICCDFLCNMLMNHEDPAVHEFLCKCELPSMLIEVMNLFDYKKLACIFNILTNYLRTVNSKEEVEDDAIYESFMDFEFRDTISDFCENLSMEKESQQRHADTTFAFGKEESNETEKLEITDALYMAATDMLFVLDEELDGGELEDE